MGKKQSAVPVPLQTLARILIKEYGIRQGHWQIGAGFAFDCCFIRSGESRSYRPSAIIGMNHVMLTQVAEPTEISVDASEYNAPTPNVPPVVAVQ